MAVLLTGLVVSWVGSLVVMICSTLFYAVHPSVTVDYPIVLLLIPPGYLSMLS